MYICPVKNAFFQTFPEPVASYPEVQFWMGITPITFIWPLRLPFALHKRLKFENSDITKRSQNRTGGALDIPHHDGRSVWPLRRRGDPEWAILLQFPMSPNVLRIEMWVPLTLLITTTCPFGRSDAVVTLIERFCFNSWSHQTSWKSSRGSPLICLPRRHRYLVGLIHDKRKKGKKKP